MQQSTFERASDAAAEAIYDDRLGVEDAMAALSEFSTAVAQQHALLTAELESVVGSTLSDGVDTAERLVEQAAHLEEVFEAIDALDVILDEIKDKTEVLHATTKGILQPTEMRERAVSLLRSFGFKNKAVGERAASGVWGRVPQRVLLDGSTPEEFRQRIRGVFSDLDHCS